MNAPRVAFFTDSYHEVNGVALTSREFAAFAHRRGLPFFSVHPGLQTTHCREGDFETLEISNSRFSLSLETDLRFDLAFLRHRGFVRERLRQFRPDLVHVTGPGHAGLLGALLAHDLRAPLAASWHTNLHEYASRRLRKLGSCSDRANAWAERQSLSLVMWFYRKARILFAPNNELVELLASRTGKPCYLMPRGIDCALFNPDRRTRHDATFVLGYAGRLSPEKNVRHFAAIERALLDAGVTDFRFLIVGHGSERGWLARNLSHADLPGLQRGTDLARSYANMDVFVFPSETDTFGNVVLEAHASGVPAVVTDRGGPKFLVEPGVNGFVAVNAAEFGDTVLRLYRDRALLSRLKKGARATALSRQWDPVFEGMYEQYARNLTTGTPLRPPDTPGSLPPSCRLNRILDHDSAVFTPSKPDCHRTKMFI